MLTYNKHKDCEPMETVERIKVILKSIGIEPKEINFSIEGAPLYSCGIETPFLCTNGKGTTKEYALASGYAEFMERLQNLCFPEGNVIKETRETPDGKFMFLDELVKQDKKSIRCLYSALDFKTKHKFYKTSKVIAEIQEFFGETKNKLFCVPFYNLKTKKTIYCPDNILSLVAGSNGKCAGNTPSEALVAGISEICERYAMYTILEKAYTMPDIPPQKYEHIPEIASMINFFNKNGYSVQIKDASLGINLPVVGVCIINSKTHIGSIRYASHPILTIAIERCFTEIMQGVCEIEKIENTQNPLTSAFTYKNADFSQRERLFTKGRDFIYPEALSDNYSWKHSDYTFLQKGLSNKEMYNILTSRLLALGHEIFIRDVSFLGFPSYQIVIPNLSFIVQSSSAYGVYKEYNLKNLFYNFSDTSFSKTDIIIQDFSAEILSVFNLFHKKEYATSLNKLNNYIVIGKINNYETIDCLRKLIELKKDGYKDSLIKKSLIAFYGKDLTNMIWSEWVEGKLITDFLTEFFATHTRADTPLSPVIENLLNIYKNNIPDQNKIGELFAE